VSVGVVIPTLNEERSLPLLLADLRDLGARVPLNVVVADGGSTDDTRGVAVSAGVRALLAARGRARQLNAGAQAVRGDWLLFLHADVRLDAAAREALAAAVRPASGARAAVFRFAIELPRFWKHFIELGQRVREHLCDLPYGDQGLLVRRELFDAVGGYPDVPLMEDVAMVRRLRRETTIRRLRAQLVTSGRRYVRDGIVRTWLRHTLLITLYSAGISPQRLARWRNG
jgi:rSAM/selenodomain-associated transferase 2